MVHISYAVMVKHSYQQMTLE